MSEIEETLLPGVGVRHELRTSAGERVAVVTFRDGGRELAVYDRLDPDACSTVLRLSAAEARAMAQVLGSGPSTGLEAVQHQIEGLAIEWLRLPRRSPAAGHTIGEGRFRTRTGTSVVAVIRGDTTVPAPGPEFALEVDDVVVAVGTPEGLAQLRGLLLR